MSHQLQVSVIIPTFNRAHLVTRAVESALKEIQDQDEILVIDDGSTDDTAAQLRPYRRQIRYIQTDNQGAGAARNLGIQESRNPLIAFLDSDDEWMKGKLELCRRLMRARPDILFCFSDMAVTHSDGNAEHNFLINWHNDQRPWDEILNQGTNYSSIAKLPGSFADFKVYIGDMYVPLAKSLYIVTSTTVVRKKQAGTALSFASNFPTFEDWYCFGKLSRQGKAAFLETETAWQHGHDGPRLTDTNSLINARTRIFLLEELWGKDKKFLKNHQKLYQELFNKEHLNIIADMIIRGMTKEARKELALLPPATSPIYYKILAQSPGWLTRALFKIKKAIY